MADGVSKLKGVNILLGISGAIPVYKSVDLASKLTGAGANVRCVMTSNATQFVRPKSFEAVTGMPVFCEMWTGPEQFNIAHINLVDASDIVVVAPATANIIAKMAHGICDDLLSTTLCACFGKPILAAPAMNDRMWGNPAVQRNVESLREMQVEIIGPESGRLACGTEGVGRMTEPGEILTRIEQIAEQTL